MAGDPGARALDAGARLELADAGCDRGGDRDHRARRHRHYEIVVKVDRGIARVSLDTGVPVTNAILAVNEFAHAWNVPRKSFQQGFEAAEAACGPPWRCRSLDASCKRDYRFRPTDW